MSVGGTAVGGTEVAVGGTDVAVAGMAVIDGEGVRVAVRVAETVAVGVPVAVAVDVPVTVGVAVSVAVSDGRRVIVGASVGGSGGVVGALVGTTTAVALADKVVGFLVRTGFLVGTAVSDGRVGTITMASTVAVASLTAMVAVGVLVTVCVAVAVGVLLADGGTATKDCTSRYAAIRIPMDTGARIVMGNPAAIELGRIGALLRASSMLRLRGAVAAPVAYSGDAALSSRVVSTSDSMVRVVRGDSLRGRAMPATIDEAVVLAGNSANAASIAIEKAIPV